tara:strand:+ start:42946 stop:43566 length:621 start_codon:yes stop_codon:yes gene_type:complete
MALHNHILHPADGDPTAAHVVAGALQIDAPNPLSVTPTGVVDVDITSSIPLSVTVTNPSSAATGTPFSVRNDDLIAINNATAPLISVQHTGIGSLGMQLRQFEAYNDGRDVAFIDLVSGGTLTGASFAPVAVGSEFEVDTAATAITGGTVIASLIIGRDSGRCMEDDINSALALNAGSPGPLTVVATDQAGQRAIVVAASLSWLEL